MANPQKEAEGTAQSMMEQYANQVQRLWSFSSDEMEKMADEINDDMNAIMSGTSALSKNSPDLVHEWNTFMQTSAQISLRGMNQALSSRTPHQFLKAQAEMIRQEMELALNQGVRIAQRSLDMAQQALTEMNGAMKQRSGSESGRSESAKRH